MPKITRNSYYTPECDFRSKPAGGNINPGDLGDGSPPAGSRGGAPVGGLGDEVPEKPKDSKKNTGKIWMF